MRWDKRSPDADRLARITEIYNSFSNTARSTAPPQPAPAARAEPTLFDAFG